MHAELDASTTITFPAGGTRARTQVLAVLPYEDGRSGVVCRETSFHPVDHTWPDHPADHGTLILGDRELPVVDCVIGAAPRSGGALLTGADIPVRRGDDGWHWFVVHVVPESGDDLVGQPVECVVDPARRAGLSAGHTACELVSLAINEATSDFWTKVDRRDVRGVPDFDAAALSLSRIGVDGSVDRYRLGKSLRRKGFLADDLRAALPDVARTVQDRLREWVRTDAPVRVEVGGALVEDRRTWVCELPDGAVRVPCGGTHVESTGQLGEVGVTLDLTQDGSELTMITTVRGSRPEDLRVHP
ncbi:hypothetical protein [Micromonospora sp. NPDC005413]|uniref:hypothetical protein n=1 Tax=Micromonospora sp. NPDC005413 TaxID=3154563 RepID=UPI0033B0EDB1